MRNCRASCIDGGAILPSRCRRAVDDAQDRLCGGDGRRRAGARGGMRGGMRGRIAGRRGGAARVSIWPMTPPGSASPPPGMPRSSRGACGTRTSTTRRRTTDYDNPQPVIVPYDGGGNGNGYAGGGYDYFYNAPPPRRSPRDRLRCAAARREHARHNPPGHRHDPGRHAQPVGLG